MATSVTNSYARAFADAVFNQHADPGKSLQEAQSFAELVASSHDLREVWEAPSILAERKRAVLDAIVKREGISPMVRNFMAVLIDHRRIEQLAEMANEFEAEINDRLGLAEAEITSARELAASERKRLEKKVAEVVGKTIKARYITDANVLGGAVIRVGSTIYDGSVRGQLQKLKEALSA